MKTIKSLVILALILVLALGILPACKRNTSGQPDPLGPSSIGILLNITSNVNAIFAGNQRQSTTISAVLKKFDGVPIGGKTVFFQICDEKGNVLADPVGFFEGNLTTVSKTTGADGGVSIGYYGPLTYEISENRDVYIWATVAWEGAQTIRASTPLQLISDPLTLRLDIAANPNVLSAGKTRETSLIAAKVTTSGGVPVAEKKMFFEILDVNGNRAEIGFFDNNRAIAEKITSSDGSVAVQYYGPLAEEIEGQNQLISIRATISLSGDFREVVQSKAVDLRIIADPTNIILNLTAVPNVLFATTTRDMSNVTVKVMTPGGAPLVGKSVFFEILNANGNRAEIGFFDNNLAVVEKATNSDGSAVVQYFGPLAEEVQGQSQDIIIRATVSLSESYSEPSHVRTTILHIISDPTNILLNMSASPNVLFAGKARDSSLISAIVLTPGGAPLRDKTVFFEIVNDEGQRVNFGFFENNRAVIDKLTGADGSVKVSYFGPLATELMGLNQKVSIRATVAWQGNILVENTTPIEIIADATALSFDIGANPQVLYATSNRPLSQISAIAKYEGTPIANRRVYFQIMNGPGYFTGNKRLVYALTGADGTATITYIGPTKEEIFFDQMVTIRGHLETSYPPDEYDSGKSYKSIDIRIYREE